MPIGRLRLNGRYAEWVVHEAAVGLSQTVRGRGTKGW